MLMCVKFAHFSLIPFFFLFFKVPIAWYFFPIEVPEPFVVLHCTLPTTFRTNYVLSACTFWTFESVSLFLISGI